jgi:hypothetical protein
LCHFGIQVKLVVYVEYMRAARLFLSILFLVLMCSNQGMQIIRNFWLSNWADANEAEQQQQQEQEVGTGTDANSTAIAANSTGAGDEAFRLSIYGIFGISEGILNVI